MAFVHGALNEPTAFAVAERILCRTAEFLTEGRSPTRVHDHPSGSRRPVWRVRRCGRKLIALRVPRNGDALRRRFEQARSEGDLPRSADASDLARFVTACYFQGMTVQAINGASRDDLASPCGWLCARGLNDHRSEGLRVRRPGEIIRVGVVMESPPSRTSRPHVAGL